SIPTWFTASPIPLGRFCAPKVGVSEPPHDHWLCIRDCGTSLMAMMLWRDAAAIVDLLAGRGEHDAGGGKKVSAPGQVLVYLMYRQPFTHARVQEALIVLFGLGALLCLAIVMLAGQFSIHAAQMAAAEAIPVVFLVTTLAASRPTPLPHELL